MQETCRPAVVVDTHELVQGRHALAIDERRDAELLASAQIEEVWFRGTHADVTGAADPCLARITPDRVLDGALRAGLHMGDPPSTTVRDALTTSRWTPAMGLLAGVRLLN